MIGSDAPMPPPPTQVVEVARVSKWFGDVVAVSDVSFSVGPGVTALLGPNGAGKSTMLRMMAGVTPPSQGTVQILGSNPRKNLAIRGQIGLVSQEENLFDTMRAVDFVALAATLNHLDDSEGRARAVLSVVELDPDDRRPIATYSKGMKQRVKVAQALIHEPNVLLLDEPLTGLDPRQRLHMIELISNLGSQGVCVIVSSHVLEEVERFGSRVLVIAQGRLAAHGQFDEIRELMDDRPHRVSIRSDEPRRLGAALLSGGVSGVSIADDTLIVETNDVSAFRRGIARTARDIDVRLDEVKPLDDDLESVFKYLVGR